MNRYSVRSSALTLVVLSAVCLGGDRLSLSALEDGSILVRNTAGVALRRDYSGGAVTPTSMRSHAYPSSTGMPTWDPPVTLASTKDSAVAGPIVDSSGNVWVVTNDAENLVALRSNGASGTWQPPHIIGPSVPNIGAVSVAVDRAGGFYVAYGTSGDLNATSNPLLWTKYTPAAGWQASAQIYNSPQFFSETFCAVDHTGRLVVIFNPYSQGASGVSSIASNPAQTAWGPVQIVSPISDGPILPSLGANSSGTRLALVYLLKASVVRQGMRYTFFNSSTGLWNKVSPVPDSQNATFSGYTTLNAYPITVDEPGNVTFIAALATTVRGHDSAIEKRTTTFTVAGFRFEGGVWSMQQLTAPSQSLPGMDNFGSAAISPSGPVLMVTPLFDGSAGVNVTVFRYTPGQGWSTEIAAHYGSTVVDRCRVAWYEGTGAVVVYTDYTSIDLPLMSALYSNGEWSNGPPPPGNPTDVAFPGLASAVTGEAILTMPNNPEILATFLRP